MAAISDMSGIMTIGEVAACKKVFERSICQLAAAKKIQTFKVGGSWRFSRADIDTWIKKLSMEAVEPSKKDRGEQS